MCISEQSKSRSRRRPASMWLNHRYREQARSHMDSRVFTASVHDTKTCGSELARDEASPFNIFISVTPPSRASSLPQEERVHPKLGRLLGRLASAFDLRRPVKPRWPNAGIAQWASRHGCRDSRAGPWMALRGGPTEQCRSEGTPSLGEVPSGGAEALWLLSRFSKVTRRKGETASSRYRRNGYTHQPTQYTPQPEQP